MDPDAALDQIRQALAKIAEVVHDYDTDERHDQSIVIDASELDAMMDIVSTEFSDLLDSFEGLGQWIRRGGVLPMSWGAKRNGW